MLIRCRGRRWLDERHKGGGRWYRKSDHIPARVGYSFQRQGESCLMSLRWCGLVHRGYLSTQHTWYDGLFSFLLSLGNSATQGNTTSRQLIRSQPFRSWVWGHLSIVMHVLSYIAIVHLASANIIITMDRSDIIAIAVVSASVVYIALASYFDYPLDDRDIPLPPYHWGCVRHIDFRPLWNISNHAQGIVEETKTPTSEKETSRAVA